MKQEDECNEEQISEEDLKKILDEIPKAVEESARVQMIKKEDALYPVYPGHKPYPPALLLKDLIDHCFDKDSFKKRIEEVEHKLDEIDNPFDHEFVCAALDPIKKETEKFSTLEDMAFFVRTACRYWDKLREQRKFRKKDVGDFTRELEYFRDQIEDELKTQNDLKQKNNHPEDKSTNEPLFPMRDELWENLTITFIVKNDENIVLEFQSKKLLPQKFSLEDVGLKGKRGWNQKFLFLIQHIDEGREKKRFTVKDEFVKDRESLRKMCGEISTILRKITGKTGTPFGIVNQSTGDRILKCNLKLQTPNNISYNDFLHPIRTNLRCSDPGN